MSMDRWPSLHFGEWRETCDTLHMWTQIVGKIRMELTPPLNHWWHTTLYVSPRGLTTSLIPQEREPFEIEFDFVNHNLWIRTFAGTVKGLPLYARPVAEFHDELMGTLRSIGLDARIWTMPQEFPDPIRFEQDRKHAAYDPEYASRFHRVLLSTDAVLKEFRGGFIGKCSPVHFFWGSFDLAVTRFSGKLAPERPGADAVTREAYSHECSSAGWWPGGGPVDDAAFYSYSAPEPPGFGDSLIRPAKTFYSRQAGEFLLMYDDLQTSRSPENALMEFLQSTYEAAANLGRWNRDALERSTVQQNLKTA